MFKGKRFNFFKRKDAKLNAAPVLATQPPALSRQEIKEAAFRVEEDLRNLFEDHTRILPCLSDQLPSLSKVEENTCLIKEKIECIQRSLPCIEEGLADAKAFLQMIKSTEGIEDDLLANFLEIKELKRSIKDLKAQNATLRQNLNKTQHNLISSGIKEAQLEAERDQIKFLHALSLINEDTVTYEDPKWKEDIVHEEAIEKELNINPEITTDAFPSLPSLAEMEGMISSKQRIFFNLIKSYIEKNYYTIAYPLCNSSLTDLIETHGKKHIDVIRMMDMTTFVCRGMERYDEAANLQIQSLALKEEILESDDLSIIFSLNCLSALYGKLGDINNAELFCIRALERSMRVFGKEDFKVGEQLLNLAAIYTHTKTYDDAVNTYQKAYAIFVKHLGVNAVQSLQTKEKWALVLRDAEHYGSSIKLLKELIEEGSSKLETIAMLDNRSVIEKQKKKDPIKCNASDDNYEVIQKMIKDAKESLKNLQEVG